MGQEKTLKDECSLLVQMTITDRALTGFSDCFHFYWDYCQRLWNGREVNILHSC